MFFSISPFLYREKFVLRFKIWEGERKLLVDGNVDSFETSREIPCTTMFRGYAGNTGGNLND